MRIVALMTIRNEELYLPRVLTHLVSQGIETCIIDNDSTDASLEIARSFLNRGVIRIERIPFRGCFELLPILKKEERLAREIEADWFMHHDADEIREAPAPFATLAEGIAAVDAQGFNAVNFSEFVFLPTDEEDAFEQTDFVEEMRYYYYFSPRPRHRTNAWRKINAPVDLKRNAGHHVDFPGKRIYPEDFILRHYIFLSKNHGNVKFGTRIVSPKELKKFGWSVKRTGFAGIILPKRERLRIYRGDRVWDRSDPWTAHEFMARKNTEPG